MFVLEKSCHNELVDVVFYCLEIVEQNTVFIFINDFMV